MATVSHDSQSFLIDGRRVWLVSGAIHYPRVPRELWRSRIRAAREAGLNCIETYVFWNAHEPTPGRFDFTGDLDLAAFVRTVGEEGLLCMVRPGPFVCAEWDNGGLPAWLTGTPGMKVREGHPGFLEACARYLSAVMEQVRDLQITSPITPMSVRPGDGVARLVPGGGGFTGQGGGPIVLMQVENEWFCHHPEASGAYNDELLRYMREGGCTTPVVNCNNLWQRVDRTIDAWNGARNLARDLRQLGVVQPEAPRLITEYWPGWFDQWDGPHSRNVDAGTHLYRMAGIAAVGGQANLYMFHGGTNFAFWGGRTVANPACFMTTSYDYDAPLLEGGGRAAKYALTKRLGVFLSQFGHVFAQARPDEQHTAPALNETDHPPAVLQLTGSAGQAVFILQSEKDARDAMHLMLPNGLTLPVTLAGERAAWLLLDTPLTGEVTLDHTNLRPWAFVDRRLLVVFGPAGSAGVVSLNHAVLHVTVPAGDDRPAVHAHEGLTVVVLSQEQVDQAYVTASGVELRDEHDRVTLTLDVAGAIKRPSAKPWRKPPAPRLGGWRSATLEQLADGTDAAYRAIDGPASLESLGQSHGYGWYRLQWKKPPRAAGKLLVPQSGDRLHVFADGKPVALLGLGPGATFDPAEVTLAATTTMLADNLGRMNYAWRVGERKGVFGDVYAVKPAALGRPQVVRGRSPDPFELRGYVPHRRAGESRPADTLIWKLRATRKPRVLDIDALPGAAVIYVNGEAMDYYEVNHCARYGRWLLPANARELRLALFGPLDRKVALGKHLRLYSCTANLTDDATWAFAPWTVPDAEAFTSGGSSVRGPRWWRCTFRVTRTDVPLWLEPRGLTKGQIILNGHNAGRYFVAAGGKPVPPQTRYYLPEPWLRTDGDNELLFFDEHGAKPGGVRLAYDRLGPYG
mgnify:CR=1 FL=1